MSTNNFCAKDIKREWHLIDAKNQILGRISTEVAKLLMGKNKPQFVSYLDLGDNVVVINADKVKLSGKKEIQKTYHRFSGFPGGLRTEKIADIRKRKPEEIIIHCVKGMLPKSILGRQMIKKLYVFAGTDHPFKQQIKEEVKNG